MASARPRRASRNVRFASQAVRLQPYYAAQRGRAEAMAAAR